MDELESFFSLSVEFIPFGFLLAALSWLIGWVIAFLVRLLKNG